MTVAETTKAWGELAQVILWRSALRIRGMIGRAPQVIWMAVTQAVHPLSALSRRLAAPAPRDLGSLLGDAPGKVHGLVKSGNGVMTRLGLKIEALHNFTGRMSNHLRAHPARRACRWGAAGRWLELIPP